MDYLQQKLAGYDGLLNERLRRIIEPRPPAQHLYQMMAYHFGWLNERLEPDHDGGGKRLRPFICLLVCESPTGSPAAALPGALAVELIHNFSLVHDHIQDASLRRRRRPAVWAVWGMPQAVNVGDGLFALAHLALTDVGLDPGTARDGWPAPGSNRTRQGTTMVLSHNQNVNIRSSEFVTQLLGGRQW